jgi:hypothetical protein
MLSTPGVTTGRQRGDHQERNRDRKSGEPQGPLGSTYQDLGSGEVWTH